MSLWKGHTALITGGASGLGAQCAKTLHAAGMKIALFDLDTEGGSAMAQALHGVFAPVDVADPQSVADGFAQVKDALGAPRVMINCAGIVRAGKTTSKGEPHDYESFNQTIQVNLMGTFNCATHAATHMAALDPIGKDDARGVIVNTASIAAYEGQVGQIAYSASKAAVAGMTLPMARDLAPLGIRVCALAPGLFKTPMVDGLPEDVQASLGAQVPYPPRLGDPSEFAGLVSHILENPMLNGEVIRIDGAIRMGAR